MLKIVSDYSSMNLMTTCINPYGTYLVFHNIYQYIFIALLWLILKIEDTNNLLT